MARRLALLVGNTEFEDSKLDKLAAPYNDIVEFQGALKEFGDFETTAAINAGLIDVQSRIAELFDEREPEDLVLLYYTGHGVRDDRGDLYLALPGTKTRRLRATSLASQFIRTEMTNSRSQSQVLILDCCHSGSFMDGDMLRRDGAVELNKTDFIDAAGHGRFVLAASGANESAFEAEGRSLYTRHLVDGIRNGSAAPKKAAINVQDLHDYLYRQVSAGPAPMRPRLWVDGGTQPPVIARNPDPRRPIDPVLVEALKDQDLLRATGAVMRLGRIVHGPDKRVAEDARKALQHRLEQRDTLPVSLADVIREALHPAPAPETAQELARLREALKQSEDARATMERGRADSERKLEEALTAERAAHKSAEEQVVQLRAEVSDLKAALEDRDQRIAAMTQARPAKGAARPGQTPADPAAFGALQVFRDQLRSGGKGPEMVVIPSGEFVMGSPEEEAERGDDEAQHLVRIASSFALGRHAVTFEEFEAFCRSTGRTVPDDAGWGRGRRPVIDVSWEDAQEYVGWLSAETGAEYRLPSESEWEYAARAGTQTPFSFGATLSTDQANYDGSYTYGPGAKGENLRRTVAVDTLEAANEWGLRHMHGNVFEWCADVYEADYSVTPDDGRAHEPETSDSSARRVLRGGSWGNVPRNLRSALRGRVGPEVRFNDVGFRVARTLFTP